MNVPIPIELFELVQGVREIVAVILNIELPKYHALSWWTEKAALILDAPHRVEHAKCVMMSAAFLVYREPPTTAAPQH